MAGCRDDGVGFVPGVSAVAVAARDTGDPRWPSTCCSSTNRAAFSLGQLVATGLLDHEQVASELERVAADIGLGQREIQRTVASGLAAGLSQPRAPADLSVTPPATPKPATALTAPDRRISARRR